MKEILDNIHIVLVEPKNAGNIGSVVRAMKNMGLSRLRLVNPVPFRDEVEQRKMGYRSQEIIAAAREFTSLSAALQGISQVFLATAKKGKWKKDFLSPAQAAARIVEGASHIYLYQRYNLQSFNTRVQGWIATPWGGPTWNAWDLWVK